MKRVNTVQLTTNGEAEFPALGKIKDQHSRNASNEPHPGKPPSQSDCLPSTLGKYWSKHIGMDASLVLTQYGCNSDFVVWTQTTNCGAYAHCCIWMAASDYTRDFGAVLITNRSIDSPAATGNATVFHASRYKPSEGNNAVFTGVLQNKKSQCIWKLEPDHWSNHWMPRYKIY